MLEEVEKWIFITNRTKINKNAQKKRFSLGQFPQKYYICGRN